MTELTHVFTFFLVVAVSGTIGAMLGLAVVALGSLIGSLISRMVKR